MSDSQNPERGTPVQLPINLFGRYESQRFRKFEPPYLERELARLAEARIYYDRGKDVPDYGGEKPKFGGNGEEKPSRPIAYSVSFQPCPDPEQRSQDRYIVESWPMPDGTWTFAGVFDGHAGEVVSEYVHETLPSSVQDALSALLEKTPAPDPAAITSLLSNCITALDDTIIRSLRLLFAPEETASALYNLSGASLLDFTSPDAYTADLERMMKMDIEEIKKLINDEDREGANSKIVERCKQGSTVLVALVNPTREKIWVASLGDCVAVLGSVSNQPTSAVQTTSPTQESEQPGHSEATWELAPTIQILSQEHNARLDEEFMRVHAEHPGETTCLFRSRVLGAIAVTRAIGDMLFKLPAQYTKRVLMNSTTGFRTSTPVSDIIQRVISPPYLSAVPKVNHVHLAKEAEKQDEANTGVSKPPVEVSMNAETGMSEDSEVMNISTNTEIGISVVSSDAHEDKGAESESDEDGDVNDNVQHVDVADEPPPAGTSVSSPPPRLAGSSSVDTLPSQPRHFLILCSDGLVDLERREALWARLVEESLRLGASISPKDTPSKDGNKSGLQAYAYIPTQAEDARAHPALHLLKSALGGDDTLRISALLSLEAMGRWLDDTTIVVVPL